MKYLLWMGLGLWIGSVSAQEMTQTVRGTVRDAYTQQPVAAAYVKIISAPGEPEARTDSAGEFHLPRVPIGRHDIAFYHVNYEGFTRPGVLVATGKETVLEVLLEERLYEMDEVVLSPMREKGRPGNEMATVSVYSFEVEETRKFAGGLDDPTRLAANLPGVTDNAFISDNLISVRANSPRGLLYRVEGVEIPNPNHFARIGSSGGTFTLFSNNLLTNSDFFTGAFPAEFGNATAGVFDIRFRNGNNEQREYALQASVLGIDLTAEGPFREGGEASYLVNYRFSTLTAANLVINYLQLPEFQDLSFKLNFPTKKYGSFRVFGIGGLSSRLREAERDPTLWTEDFDRFELQLDSDMGAVGVGHRIALNKKQSLNTVAAATYSQQTDNRSYLEPTGGGADPYFLRLRDLNEYQRQPITVSSTLSTVFSSRHYNQTGAYFTTTQHNHRLFNYDYVRNRLDTLVRAEGRTNRFQAFTQSEFRLGDQLTLTVGAHLLWFDLNNQTSIEPRAGLSYAFSRRSVLSLGYGLHSQTESFATYSLQNTNAVENRQPNADLRFVRAHHGVISYRLRFLENHQFTAEAYYQRLFDVPVEPGTSFSVLNLSELNQVRQLVNDGEGYNAGLDLSLERYTQRGLYYLINLSVFDSRYRGGDGTWRSTAFDNDFKANFLMGREWEVGKTKQNLLGLNGNFSAIGGRRFTPLDLEASRLARETVFDLNRAWEGREPGLFIFDFTLSYRKNRPNASHLWGVQIKNLWASRVPEYREYDALLDEEITQAGAAVLPVLSYKVEF